MTDKHLRYVFALLAQGFTATEVKAYCLCRWAGLKVLHRYGKVWACKYDGLQFRSPRNSGCASAILNKFRLRSTCTEFVLAAEQVERATHALDWLDSVPTLPVRLAKNGSHRAIDAQFQGVPFETFIVCDNLYQGYLATKQCAVGDDGRKKYSYKHWGTVDDHGKFHPNQNWFLAPPAERRRLIFSSGWDLGGAAGLSEKRFRGCVAYEAGDVDRQYGATWCAFPRRPGG